MKTEKWKTQIKKDDKIKPRIRGWEEKQYKDKRMKREKKKDKRWKEKTRIRGWEEKKRIREWEKKQK